MELKSANNVASHEDGTQTKKPYHQPVISEYGQLHRLTQGSNGNGLDANSTHTKKSDPTVKENIVRIDTHPLGIGLYLFDYKTEHQERCGYGRQFGVMADEVESVMPEAVSVHPDGYRMVNYAMLGISHPNH